MSGRLAERRPALLRAEERAAADALGPSHPLVRLVAWRAAVARQLAVTLVALAGAAAGSVAAVPRALDLLVAAGVVAALLAGALAGLVQQQRARAQELLAAGLGPVALACVAAERRRLLDPRTRHRLARCLERLVSTVERWERIPVAARPPAGALRLRPLVPELRALAAALEEPRAGIRGVALAARLLAGGYASPLHEGRVEELPVELELARRLLALEDSPRPGGSEDAQRERLL